MGVSILVTYRVIGTLESVVFKLLAMGTLDEGTKSELYFNPVVSGKDKKAGATRDLLCFCS